MNNDLTLFIQLVQIALGHRSVFSVAPTEEQWDALYEMAFRQTIAGVLFPALGKLQDKQRAPRKLFMKWYSLVETIKERNAELNKASTLAVKTFRRDGMRSIILKGQGLATLYPDPLLRQPGDVDIWVEGKRDELVRYGHRYYPEGKPEYHHMKFHAIEGVEMELHFRPSWLNCYFTNRRMQRYFSARMESLFSHTVRLGTSKTEVPVPDAAFNRVFVLQHIYRHVFGAGVGLRQLLDYYYVLLQGFTPLERQETMQVLGRLHMGKFAAAVMYVLQNVFAMPDEFLLCPPNEEEGRYLLSEIVRAGNFGKFDPTMKQPERENKLHSFFRITRRAWRQIGHYPEEVLWSPVYRAWHFAWRLLRGYRI